MIMILTTKLHLFITNIDNVDSYDGNFKNVIITNLIIISALIKISMKIMK